MFIWEFVTCLFCLFLFLAKRGGVTLPELHRETGDVSSWPGLHRETVDVPPARHPERDAPLPEALESGSLVSSGLDKSRHEN